MPTSFLDLPGEIHNKIYGCVLLKPGAINLHLKEFIAPYYEPRQHIQYDWWLMRISYEPRVLDLNLLYVSKTISKEAKSFFFSQNVFNFAWCCGPWTYWIFARIGLDSVSQMEHIMIQFPETQGEGEPLPYGRSDPTFETLRLVQRHCTGLKTLTTSFYRDQLLDHRLNARKYSEGDIRKLLEWADAEYRSIPSLRGVIVWVSRRDRPAKMGRFEQIGDSLELEMERLGWRLENITEPINNHNT